ncbi:hypothetical protein protein, putative [Babesia ovis]|uniref:Uncharacterized protein n=1 Tax=Babesia ovis TaxID=5869 RepID=A0A9W5WTU3_BABOV|nr:hypothetical protein protein, putative [Babesia ovis]
MAKICNLKKGMAMLCLSLTFFSGFLFSTTTAAGIVLFDGTNKPKLVDGDNNLAKNILELRRLGFSVSNNKTQLETECYELSTYEGSDVDKRRDKAILRNLKKDAQKLSDKVKKYMDIGRAIQAYGDIEARLKETKKPKEVQEELNKRETVCNELYAKSYEINGDEIVRLTEDCKEYLKEAEVFVQRYLRDDDDMTVSTNGNAPAGTNGVPQNGDDAVAANKAPNSSPEPSPNVPPVAVQFVEEGEPDIVPVGEAEVPINLGAFVNDLSLMKDLNLVRNLLTDVLKTQEAVVTELSVDLSTAEDPQMLATRERAIELEKLIGPLLEVSQVYENINLTVSKYRSNEKRISSAATQVRKQELLKEQQDLQVIYQNIYGKYIKDIWKYQEKAREYLFKYRNLKDGVDDEVSGDKVVLQDGPALPRARAESNTADGGKQQNSKVPVAAAESGNAQDTDSNGENKSPAADGEIEESGGNMRSAAVIDEDSGYLRVSLLLVNLFALVQIIILV